ncbi:uncharacterized protein LOC129290095 [Prosopis cineraria]|uniref:uncharacterized protein LOC129290095 n=1 Tax=Prosopis cineraria TaxID=364024 RepID=UPI00240F76E0|nr:uncharacterized protein LOC129290095 [Prosopis cineraria]
MGHQEVLSLPFIGSLRKLLRNVGCHALLQKRVIQKSPFCQREDDNKVLLLRRQSSPIIFLVLDKAAVKNNSNGERGEREGNEEEVCTAEQVSDVKSLDFSLPLGSPSSPTPWFLLLVTLCSANSHLALVDFFALKFVIAYVVRNIIQSPRIREKVKPIWSTTVGMLCSVLCCIAAWLVEWHRLSLSREQPDKKIISLNIVVLTPQYFLLRLMEGFNEHEMKTFVQDRAPESMKTFVELSIEMLSGIIKAIRDKRD